MVFLSGREALLQKASYHISMLQEVLYTSKYAVPLLCEKIWTQTHAQTLTLLPVCMAYVYVQF